MTMLDSSNQLNLAFHNMRILHADHHTKPVARLIIELYINSSYKIYKSIFTWSETFLWPFMSVRWFVNSLTHAKIQFSNIRRHCIFWLRSFNVLQMQIFHFMHWFLQQGIWHTNVPFWQNWHESVWVEILGIWKGKLREEVGSIFTCEEAQNIYSRLYSYWIVRNPVNVRHDVHPDGNHWEKSD